MQADWVCDGLWFAHQLQTKSHICGLCPSLDVTSKIWNPVGIKTLHQNLFTRIQNQPVPSSSHSIISLSEILS